MTAREELAKHREDCDSDCGAYYGRSCGWGNKAIKDNAGCPEYLTDALLASPALARVIRDWGDTNLPAKEHP